MYQKLIIIGNLGREPEMKYSPNGDPVTNFSAATSYKQMGNAVTVNVTEWIGKQLRKVTG